MVDGTKMPQYVSSFAGEDVAVVFGITTSTRTGEVLVERRNPEAYAMELEVVA
jgi:hypothetical protein